MKPILITLLFLGLYTGHVFAASRPPLKTILETSVPQYAITSDNLLQALSRVASEFGVPVGIEWQGAIRAGGRIEKTWQATTVGAILKDLVSTDPEYDLVVANGVAHVRPRAATSDASNFLNLVLPSFSVRDVFTADALAKLQREVRSIIELPGAKLPAVACAGSGGYGVGEVRQSVSVQDATVRDALDKLLLGSEMMMWLVAFDLTSTTPRGYNATIPLYPRAEQVSGEPHVHFIPPYSDPVTGKVRGDWRAAVAARP